MPTHNAVIGWLPGAPSPFAPQVLGPHSITGGLTIGDSNNTGALTISSTLTMAGSQTVTVAGPGSITVAPLAPVLSVVGAGAALTNSNPAQISSIDVGTVAGSGTLVVTQGGQVSGFKIEVGLNANTQGAMYIGAGSTVTVPHVATLNGWLSIGRTGSGALLMEGGGTAISSVGAIASDGTGIVVIRDPGSKWQITSADQPDFHVGGTGAGSLSLFAGGTLDAGPVPIIISRNSGSGYVLVDGNGSLLTTTQDIFAGGHGEGTLTLANGGTASTPGTLWVTNTGSTRTGTLNIGGDPLLGGPLEPGTIQAGAVRFGTNLGTINFNHTSDAYLFSLPIDGPGSVNQLAGTTVLTAANTYTGPTTISGGTLMVNGSIASPTTVNAGGTLGGTGTINNDVMNAGLVAPGPGPGGLGTLTIAGNYVGNGGTLAIKTALAGDPSPTDRLVITGNTSGNTTVQVTNFGGTGAPTAEGIKIIDVGGASNGAFSLQGHYIIGGQQAVVAGAYAYTLQQNGYSTPTDGDWYLRSSLTNVPVLPGLRPPPFQPGSPSTPSDTPPPPGGSPPGSPVPQVPAGPLFQPGVPLYESYGQVLLGLNELSTLRERVGNRHRGEGDAMAQIGPVKAVAGAPASVGPVWGRFEGHHLNLNPSTTSRSSFDADYLKFEAGIDAVTLDQGFGKFVFGITGHYNEADADIASFYGNGSIRTRGGGFGGTATWYGYDGFYVDGQARASWYSSKLNSVLVGPVISDNDGFGYALGLESGKRFGIGGGWSLTPQAQLTYGAVDFDTFTDRFGANVSLGRAESLLGRAGISLDHARSWRDASGQLMRSDVYGIANLHYEFLDGANVDVSGTRFASSADRLWGGIGAGGTFSWANDRYAIYGEVSYNTSLEDTGVNYSYKGTAGFRLRW